MPGFPDFSRLESDITSKLLSSDSYLLSYDKTPGGGGGAEAAVPIFALSSDSSYVSRDEQLGTVKGGVEGCGYDQQKYAGIEDGEVGLMGLMVLHKASEPTSDEQDRPPLSIVAKVFSAPSIVDGVAPVGTVATKELVSDLPTDDCTRLSELSPHTMALLSFALSPLTPLFVDAVFVPPHALDNALVQQQDEGDSSMEMKVSKEIGGELAEAQSKQEKSFKPPEPGCVKVTVSGKSGTSTERVEMKEKMSPCVNVAEEDRPLRVDAATLTMKEEVEEKRREEQWQLQREEDHRRLDQLQEELRRMEARQKRQHDRQVLCFGRQV